MEQEHRITYKAGITRRPSDFLCGDGELAECINLTTDNEELKPIVQPAEFINDCILNPGGTVPIHDDVPTIVYVHIVNGVKRYIGYLHDQTEDGDLMLWGTVSDGVFYNRGYFHGKDGHFLKHYGGEIITSIGNTLIVNRESGTTGTSYYLWDGTQYSGFTELPKPDVEFYLKGNFALTQDYNEYRVENSLKYGDAITVPGCTTNSQEELNNLIVGLYSKNKKAIGRKKLFCEPFFVRTALELYDGSYTHISQPILFFPSVRDNTEFSVWSVRGEMSALTYGCKLFYKNKTDIEKYKDIVKGVALFVSDSIDIYDTISDQPEPAVSEVLPSTTVVYDSICRADQDTNPDLSVYRTRTIKASTQSVFYITVIKKREEAEIANDIKSCSIFYKLCMLPYNDTSFTNVAEHIDTHTLENITTQERLEYDDYYSFCPIKASVLYPYNARLNLAGAKRGLFDGFDFFLPYDNTSPQSYNIYVHIKTNTGGRVVKKHIDSTYQKMGIWFYYPDPRADFVTIYTSNAQEQDLSPVLNAQLTEHSGLNGAFYFYGYPHGNSGDTPTAASGSLNTENYAYELLSNYVLTSEVNNPWVFKAEGYNRVGTGKILAMSTITQALSQGQFGQFPLLVFSESGIWAMEVDNTGLYQSVYPMSREVCINPNGIIQTDGAVFFVSKKGLMMIAGNDVRCMSEQMDGVVFNIASKLGQVALNTEWQSILDRCTDTNTFLDYIRDEGVLMAYDYVDSRIIIQNDFYTYAYVYNIKDGTISKTTLPAGMTNVVNNYPDYLMQGDVTRTVIVEGEEVEETIKAVYSFYEKPREEQVSTRQLGFLLTRPMKLAGPVSQASLRQLMNVGTWQAKDAQGNELSCVKTKVYLSEDMQKWYYDQSRFGAAARYYRLALFIKMLPTERLSGTIITSQERRSNHIR